MTYNKPRFARGLRKPMGIGRKDHLLLSDPKEEEGISITALSKEEYEAIVYFGQTHQRPESYPSTLKFSPKARAFMLKGVKIKLSAIELFGIPKYASKLTKFMRSKKYGQKLYYYNYDSGHFNYFGVGIEEPTAAWTTICKICSIEELYMIYGHKNQKDSNS